jgi:tRNA A37 threonylcarbamoyltransferase TsaD
MNALENSVPLVKFPFVSLIATGKHTEIVLSRGIGLHTVLGLTIDTAVGYCFDKSYVYFKKYDNIL